MTTVSVVIPTFNRRERLHRVLSGLADQTWAGNTEVIVVSDGSTDHTDDYLVSDETPLPVVAVTQPNRGPAAARNRGVEVASGELIVFIDDDVVPDRGLIQAHVAAHDRLGVDTVVIGPMLDPPDHRMSRWIKWEQAMLAKQYSAMARGDYEPTARQFFTGNASLMRQHVIDVGGFDASYRRAEDVELAYRLADHGMRFAFEPSAIGYHYAERSFAAWRATGYAYGRNDMVMVRASNRTNMLAWIANDYHERNAAVRALVRACIPHPWLASIANRGLRAAAWVSDVLRLRSITRQTLSGIYNVAYYSGVADELGGPIELWDLVDRGRHEQR